MSLRRRLTLAVLAVVVGMAATGALAVLALRAQGGSIERAEAVFTGQLAPAIDLLVVLPDARQTLPERPTVGPASAEDVAAWQGMSREVTQRLIAVRGAKLSVEPSASAVRASDAWVVARELGNGLLRGPASASDILEFDRSYRQVRAEAADLLGALKPIVARPMVEAPRELERVGTWLLAAIALISVGSLAASAALLRSVVGAVSDLRSSALRMADGDLDARAPALAGELGDLSTVLNVMAERLGVEREALTHRATRDGLTGVLNSGEIKERLAQEVKRSRRSGDPVGAVLLDLDHFKRVNDTYGHQSGDHALVSFARNIEAALRPADLVGRYGGEEFLVVLPGADGTATEVVAERIRAAVAASPVALTTGEEIWLTTSAGATWGQRGIESAEVLVARADAALYQAKGDGRNRVVLASRAVSSP